MEFNATISTSPDHNNAVREVCADLSDFKPDLAVVFASHHHGPEFTELLHGIREGTDARNLIGCTAESIIGPDREVERSPALALWAARLPGVRILPFVLDQDDLHRMDRPEDWHDRVGVPPDEQPGIVILPDPFSIDIAICLKRMDAAFPGSSIVGGMASGGTGAGQNRLLLNDQVLRQGLVGVSLSGPIRIRAVTSQGCRPVGSQFVVTRADNNIIYEGGGRPILNLVQEMYERASAHERELLQNGLHVGVVVDERLDTFGPGDFLVRNVMGIVDEKGLAVTDVVRPGQTVQFHVRDARTADEEMEALLRREVTTCGHSPAGGLLFSCNGRGTRMFQQPDHDVDLVNRFMDDCRVAGFFAQGEIGPVGHRTFVHGFTSTLILFYGA